MKLPWTKLKRRKQDLEEEVEKIEKELEEVKEEKQSYENRFEAEQERRKKLSREKQEVEERINRLEDKLKSQEKEEDNGKDEDIQIHSKTLEFEEAKKIIQKLSTIKSEEDDLITVYSPEEVSDLSRLKDLKNSVSKEMFSKIKEEEGFTAFLNPELGAYILSITPFFSEKVEISNSFDLSGIQEFIESEKYWILASAGYTEIFKEEEGGYEQLEVVKSRVNREHSKGGFSQGRFERKRDEQVEGHIEDVKEAMEEIGLDEEKTHVLGDEKVSKKLPGEYLGGFDPNRKKPGRFYKFRLKRF